MSTEIPQKVGTSERSKAALARFSKRMRKKAGNKCENCGDSNPSSKIQLRRILERQDFPQFEVDEGNALVLCEKCRSGIDRPKGSIAMGGKIMQIAQYRLDLRNRIADYIENNAPQLDQLPDLIRGGYEIARNWSLNHFNR